MASSQKEKPKTESRYTYVMNYGSGEQTEQKIPRFKGALSADVDEISNTLVVSAGPYLLDNVGTLIEVLDEAAKHPPSAIRVVETGLGRGADIRDALNNLLGRSAIVVQSPTTASPQKKKSEPAKTDPKRSANNGQVTTTTQTRTSQGSY